MVLECLSDCSVLTHHQGISNPPLKRAVGWRWAWGWEGTQPGHLTRTGSMDIPCYMASYSAAKWEEKEERGTFMVIVFVFWSNCYTFTEALLPGTGWTSACWWVMNKFPLFALLLCMAFAFLVKLPLPQPTSLLFSSPVLLKRGSEWLLGGLTANQGQSTTMYCVHADFPEAKRLHNRESGTVI